MTSREIIRRALRRQQPPRLPVFMSSLGVDDRVVMPFKAVGPLRPGVDPGCARG